MTSDSKPSEGAMRAAAVVGDICDGFWDEDSFEEAGRAIDREAVTPAVKPLVAALERCERAINDNSRSAGVSVAGFNALRKQLADAATKARAALEPWRHLLNEKEND